MYIFRKPVPFNPLKSKKYIYDLYKGARERENTLLYKERVRLDIIKRLRKRVNKLDKNYTVKTKECEMEFANLLEVFDLRDKSIRFHLFITRILMLLLASATIYTIIRN